MYVIRVTEPATVVIVEDEAILAQLLEYDLQRLGYQVQGVHSSGEAALAAVAEQQPDLVLMDITLQGELDGIETARRLLRKHGVPSIFLTAHSDPDTVLRATQSAEPFAYLRKPYNDKDLELALLVTMRKVEAEARRERQRQLLIQALEDLPETAIVLCDDDGCVALVNSEAESLTGWDRDEAIGTPFDEVCEFWGTDGQPRAFDVTTIDASEIEGTPLLIKPRRSETLQPVRLALSRAEGAPGTLVAIHTHGAIPAGIGDEIVVMCGWCRLILQEGAWRRLETYLARQGKRVSHGMCDSCLAKFTRPLFPGADANG